MELLYDQIVNTDSMVVLCDASGTVLHSVGDDDFLARASKVALQPGAIWAESHKGTNAIGTALFHEVPTLVHAGEHFIHANHFLTCSAAPIFDPRGNILGVLDVSGDHRTYHQHTMALVKMSARMIENHWLSDDLRNVMRLHFHGRVEFIGTLIEGIIAVRPDGKILGANRSALDQLGMSSAALRMQSLTTLFGTSCRRAGRSLPFAAGHPAVGAHARRAQLLSARPLRLAGVEQPRRGSGSASAGRGGAFARAARGRGRHAVQAGRHRHAGSHHTRATRAGRCPGRRDCRTLAARARQATCPAC